MSGDQTNGYDLVIQFAEHAYQELLTAFFDAEGFLGTILSSIGIPFDPASGFSVTVAFDQPGGLPAGATDVVDIRILLGDAGGFGSLRIVASVDVDTSFTGVDLVRVNLAQKLWLTEISIVGFPIPGLNGLLANFLRQNVQLIPLVPFPVDHGTTSNIVMKNADVHIIDDRSPADKDASAFLVTFGDGTPGDKAAFTQSFVSSGGNAGVVVSMGWVCRVISPRIDDALQLNGAFTDCRLTRTVRIDEENEVDLNELSVTADDEGALDVRAKVTKSGFCYSASGTVGAKITIKVEAGRLIVDSEVEDPEVDVDIPWLCWIAGAVIGALLGALLPTVMGVIIGAVLVPLIMYIATEVIEGIVNSVAERVADALNDILVPVDIPAVGFNLIFSDVFIDDVHIVGRVKPIDTAVVRATGTVVVPTGKSFDLDSGRVGARDMPSGDLTVQGGLFDRTVQAVCGARWARTGLRDFSALYRSAIYGYSYAAPNPIPLDDLARYEPFGFVTGDRFKESMRIYGVRTNEGRWAAVQAVEVTFEFIRFRYITWEKRLATVEIVGEFTCPPGTFGNFGEVAKPGAAVFVPSPALPKFRGDVVAGNVTEATIVAEQPDPCVTLRDSLRTVVQPSAATTKDIDTVAEAIRALPLIDRRIGTFVGDVVLPRRPIGRFDARTNGFGAGQQAKWQLNGTGLAGTNGQVDLGGGSMAKYEITGNSVILTLTANKPVEMLLSVTVVDDAANVASAERCVHYEPRCPRRVRLTPTWRDYQTAWVTNYGVVEVPTPTPAPVIL